MGGSANGIPVFDAEFRSDAQIAVDFLAYWQSELTGDVASALAPMRLKGGADARLYRYQLVGEKPSVLLVL
ncbi:hypothetical protein ACLM45_12610 [Synechococcus sp. A10-1-5-9]|uniref:hypothetical protein n=1 Tax=Synechococcus sp. A10-1-5-9 TaxID=3392295 RepID=UPI0039EAC64D